MCGYVSVASDVRGHWRRQRSSRPSVPSSAKCFAMWKYGIVPRVTFPVDIRRVAVKLCLTMFENEKCVLFHTLQYRSVLELVASSMLPTGAWCFLFSYSKITDISEYIFFYSKWCNSRSVKFSQHLWIYTQF